MAINIPSAAGFIPQESVLDGLIKLYKTFGNTAKGQDTANLQQTQAQTGLTNAKATAVPQETINDTTRAGASQTSANAAKQNSITEGLKLPILQENADTEKTAQEDTNAFRNRQLTQESGQFQQTLANRIEELAQAKANSQGHLQNDTFRAQQEAKYQDAMVGATMGRTDLEKAHLATDSAQKLMQQLSMSGDPTKMEIGDQLLYQELSKHYPPEAARILLDHYKEQARQRSKYAPKGNKTSPASPIPGLPSVTYDDKYPGDF